MKQATGSVAYHYLIMTIKLMAPEVGLEPTTLRLTGAFWGLQRLAVRCTDVDYKRLARIVTAESCSESHRFSI